MRNAASKARDRGGARTLAAFCGAVSKEGGWTDERLLVVGGGGREHAIIRKLKESPTAATRCMLRPGNGGIAERRRYAWTSPPPTWTERGGLCSAGRRWIMWSVAPDDPLALGMVDALAESGHPRLRPHCQSGRHHRGQQGLFAKI